MDRVRELSLNMIVAVGGDREFWAKDPGMRHVDRIVQGIIEEVMRRSECYTCIDDAVPDEKDDYLCRLMPTCGGPPLYRVLTWHGAGFWGGRVEYSNVTHWREVPEWSGDSQIDDLSLQGGDLSPRGNVV